MEEIDRQLFLDFKDRYVLAGKRNGPHFHVDFLPFYDYSPSIRDTRTIGNDIRILNRYMCSSIFSRPDEWNTKLFNFIKLHKYNGRQLLVNGNLIKDFETFVGGLDRTVNQLKDRSSDTPFAAGTIRIEESHDAEEREEIEKAYRLIDQYELQGSFRWLPSISKLETGEVYRIIADRGGIVVQPAFFEAFGLTILEAMASGLPTFGPKFGGPLEIIEYGVSGLLLNTSKPEFIAGSLEEFVEHCSRDPRFWETISVNGIKRVQEHFNWRLYSRRLINLTKLYGFWRYSVSGKGKIKLDRYCNFLHHFLIRERALQMT